MEPDRYILLKYNKSYIYVFAVEEATSSSEVLINSFPREMEGMLDYVRNYAKKIAEVLAVKYYEKEEA